MARRAISAAATAKIAATMKAVDTPDVSTWSLHGRGSWPVRRNIRRCAGSAWPRNFGTWSAASFRLAEHRDQDGQPQGTAHLLRGVEHAGGGTRLVRRDTGDGHER